MSGTHTPRRGYTLFYGYGTVSCFEQKTKEFHSIAFIEEGLLGAQSTNVRYVCVNTLVTPPPLF